LGGGGGTGRCGELLDLDRPGTGGTSAACVLGETPGATKPPEGGGGGGGGGGGAAPPPNEAGAEGAGGGGGGGGAGALNEGMGGARPGIGGGALKFLGNVFETAGGLLLNAGDRPGGGGGAEPVGGGGGGGDAIVTKLSSFSQDLLIDSSHSHLHDDPLPVFTAAPRVFRSEGIPLANNPPN
jgi:hypothetical protein